MNWGFIMICKIIKNLKYIFILSICSFSLFSIAQDSLEDLRRRGLDQSLKRNTNPVSIEAILGNKIVLATPFVPPARSKKGRESQEQELREIARELFSDFQESNPGLKFIQSAIDIDTVQVCTKFDLSTVKIDYRNAANFDETRGLGYYTTVERAQSDNLIQAPINGPQVELDESIVDEKTVGNFNSRKMVSRDQLTYTYSKSQLNCKRHEDFKRAVVRITPELIGLNNQVLASFVYQKVRSLKNRYLKKITDINNAILEAGKHPMFSMKMNLSSSGTASLYDKQDFVSILSLFDNDALRGYETESIITETQIIRFMRLLGVYIDREIPRILRRYQEFKEYFPSHAGEIEEIEDKLKELAATIYQLKFRGYELTLEDHRGTITIASGAVLGNFLTEVTQELAFSCVDRGLGNERECNRIVHLGMEPCSNGSAPVRGVCSGERAFRGIHRYANVTPNHFKILSAQSYKPLSVMMRPNTFPSQSDISFLHDRDLMNGLLRIGELESILHTVGDEVRLPTFTYQLPVSDKGISRETYNELYAIIVEKQKENLYPVVMKVLSNPVNGSFHTRITFYRSEDIGNIAYQKIGTNQGYR